LAVRGLNAKRNIFLIGLDAFILRAVRALRGADNYEFRELLSLEEVKGDGSYPVKEALHSAAQARKLFRINQRHHRLLGFSRHRVAADLRAVPPT
jgi:hypothetical protein